MEVPLPATSGVGMPALWMGFTLFVLFLLALDLGVFHRKAHAVGLREALGWSAFWIALALAFNVLVYWLFGAQAGMEFLTGYLMEKALSVDNIFVFLMIFSYFAVPAVYQHRVLFYGILGALVMRAVFILVGASLLAAEPLPESIAPSASGFRVAGVFPASTTEAVESP
jgi:tellurite resistance protein TerC